MTIFKKGMILILVPFLFHVLFIGFLAGVRRADRRAESWVNHTIDVRFKAQRLLEKLLQSETAITWTLLGGDRDYAAAYDKATTEIPQVVNDLKDLVSDNPRQTARVDILSARIDDFLRWRFGESRLSSYRPA